MKDKGWKPRYKSFTPISIVKLSISSVMLALAESAELSVITPIKLY